MANGWVLTVSKTWGSNLLFYLRHYWWDVKWTITATRSKSLLGGPYVPWPLTSKPLPMRYSCHHLVDKRTKKRRSLPCCEISQSVFGSSQHLSVCCAFSHTEPPALCESLWTLFLSKSCISEDSQAWKQSPRMLSTFVYFLRKKERHFSGPTDGGFLSEDWVRRSIWSMILGD